MTGLTIRPWASSHRFETCSRIARVLKLLQNYCSETAGVSHYVCQLDLI